MKTTQFEKKGLENVSEIGKCLLGIMITFNVISFFHGKKVVLYLVCIAYFSFLECSIDRVRISWLEKVLQAVVQLSKHRAGKWELPS